VKVLFSRRQNDFEHVYELSSVPRIGEHVALLPNEYSSVSEHFTVTNVWWTPDHTAYDVSVSLTAVEGT
jgi:hypothetical protein